MNTKHSKYILSDQCSRLCDRVRYVSRSSGTSQEFGERHFIRIQMHSPVFMPDLRGREADWEGVSGQKIDAAEVHYNEVPDGKYEDTRKLWLMAGKWFLLYVHPRKGNDFDLAGCSYPGKEIRILFFSDCK